MSFELSDKELASFNEWREQHDKTCPHAKGEGLGAIGGRFTYSFTPTGLGVVTEIKCACGGEVNVTNVDDW